MSRDTSNKGKQTNCAVGGDARRRRRRNTFHGDQASVPPVSLPPKPSTLPHACSDDIQYSSESIAPSCTPCLANSRDTESEAYCELCVQFLCAGCQCYHGGHTMLRGEDMPGTLPLTTKQREEKHKCVYHDEEIQRYCVDDDCLCCNECLKTSHSSCNLQDLYTMIATVDFDSLKSNVISLLQEQMRRLAGTRDILTKRKTYVINEKDKQAREIKRVVAELVEKLHCLEVESLAELKLKIDTKVKSIDTMLRECNNSITGVLDDIRLIDEPRQETRHNKIINMKTCHVRALNTYSHTLTELHNSASPNYCVDFIPDSRVVEALNVATSLGSFSDGADKKATARFMAKYSAKIDGDSMVSVDTCITAIEVLNDGRLLLADEFNKRIKLFDDSFQLVQSKTLSSSPRDLSVNKDLKGAATLPTDGSVLLFDIVGDDLQSTKKMRFGLEFTGVVAMEEGLILCCYGNKDFPLLQIDFDGTVLSKFEVYGGVCTQPNYVCLNTDSKMLFVTDAQQGIYCLELGQEPVGSWQYKRQGIECPLGITRDKFGRICTVDYKTNCVCRIQLGSSADMVALDHAELDVKMPQCLAYLPATNEFLVSVDSQYDIIRFKIDD